MFAHVQRHLYAARNSKSIHFLLRCTLKVILYPGMFSLALLLFLYSIAEYTFTTFYFLVVAWVWRPAFPLSWRLALLSLFVIPIFSFLHLLRLSAQRLLFTRHAWRARYGSHWRLPQDYSILPRSEANSLEERELSSPSNGDDRDFEGNPGSPRLHARSQQQSSRHPLPSLWSLQFFLWMAILCMSLWVGLHYQHPGDVRYLPLIEKAIAHPNRAGYGNQEKIFIGAMFFNNQDVIPYWSDSLIKAIHYIGADNVFVSILESGSDDRSPALLQQLNDRLAAMHVPRRILLQDKAITKPDPLDNDRRIGFLSALRNRVLEPLVENGGYDKVLFSNDIYIEPESIVELLKTADGEFDMACGLDFGHFGAYDMWVLRDKRGRLTSGIWPYFTDMEDYQAMQTESPVPVFTCWNGIVVFKADPVLPIHLRSNRTLSSEPLPFELPATHPAAQDPSRRGPSPALTPPIRFRGSASGECFSSESFLLPYDLRRLFNMRRIVANPRVVVGYDWRLFGVLYHSPRTERFADRFYVYFKWWMRHPMVKWWIERIYDGAWMHKAVMVVGDADRVYTWDGGDCHPWW